MTMFNKANWYLDKLKKPAKRLEKQEKAGKITQEQRQVKLWKLIKQEEAQMELDEMRATT